MENEIKYSLNGSILQLQGKSGYYIPYKKNSYDFYLRTLKIFLKKIMGLENSQKMSHKDAFAKVMSEKREIEKQKINFDEKRILAKNISDCEEIFPKKLYPFQS